MNQPVFTLSQVSRSIQKTLAERYTQSYWIQAEMNKLNFYPHSGHCYPELVEKVNGKIVAQMKSTLWRQDYQRINFAFMRTLKEPLKDGIKVLMQAKITYDAVHGLSLAITDIDPQFTLGDLEREKQQTIAALQQEGVWDLNRKLPLPLLLQRIAVISVESSKGFADFTQVIDGYAPEFRTQIKLFPALLQGDKSAPDIVRQLKVVAAQKDQFDLVLILRGGGGDVGLSSYNNYELAHTIATYPLPIWTGIGHATNWTVAEMVSHTFAITPTQLAEKIARHNQTYMQKIAQFTEQIVRNSQRILQLSSAQVERLQPQFYQLSQQVLQIEQRGLQQLQNRLVERTRVKLQSSDRKIHALQQQVQHLGNEQIFQVKSLLQSTFVKLENRSKQLIQHEKVRCNQQHLVLSTLAKTGLQTVAFRLEKLEQQLHYLDPQRVLQRGYSLTLSDGKIVRNTAQLKIGTPITTWVADGKIESNITQIEAHDVHGSI